MDVFLFEIFLDDNQKIEKRAIGIREKYQLINSVTTKGIIVNEKSIVSCRVYPSHRITHILIKNMTEVAKRTREENMGKARKD